ncbi:MAG: hypothetical protein K0U47_04570 [Epsilonproteobacteria bacterium]|nr:hypothetical protein [Campylobacterota bacterium]
MKKLLITLIIIVLSLTGCQDRKPTESIKLVKNGNMTIDSIVEIEQKYTIPYKSLLNRYFEKVENNNTMIQEFIGIHYKAEVTSDPEHHKYSYIVPVYVELCSTKRKKGREGTWYHAESKLNIETNIYDSGVYLHIGEMRERALLADNPNNQQDLCFYYEDEISTLSSVKRVSSNELIYTAEEINVLIDQYNLR